MVTQSVTLYVALSHTMYVANVCQSVSPLVYASLYLCPCMCASLRLPLYVYHYLQCDDACYSVFTPVFVILSLLLQCVTVSLPVQCIPLLCHSTCVALTPLLRECCVSAARLLGGGVC